MLVRRFRECLSEESDGADATRGLSVSIGVAPFDPKSAPTLEQLISWADEAMYGEKRAGPHAEQASLDGQEGNSRNDREG